MRNFLKQILAIIRELAKFVKVLDQHRFGAVMLVVVMVVSGTLIAITYLQAATLA